MTHVTHREANDARNRADRAHASPFDLRVDRSFQMPANECGRSYAVAADASIVRDDCARAFD